MIAFILQRLAASLLVLFAVVSITFLLVQFMPGSPFAGERAMSAQTKKALEEKYGRGGTMSDQYFNYLKNLSKGDLGLTFKIKNRTVNEILAQTLPVSFTLGGLAFCIASVVGIVLGVVAAVHRDQLADTAAMLFALFAISIPTFVTGPLLVLFFSIWLRIFPVGGWLTWQSMILPACVLAAPFVAYIARLTRTSMLEVLRQDFVRTARAKGLQETQVVYMHALRVAILPVVSFMGPLAANLLTGSLVVETVFQIPGAGVFFISAIRSQESFLLSAVVLVYCALLVIFNLLVDLAYTWLDRRIKLYD